MRETSSVDKRKGPHERGGVIPPADRYGAFISYRHTDPDRRWAKWLHVKLETYRVPKHLIASGVRARVGRVFRDEDELPASADLDGRIDAALAEAAALVVVCSPRTPESRWVNEEVRRFQARRPDRVFALLIEGEPEESFPPALCTGEPLAADVRPLEGESRRTRKKAALLKVVAGLLGVPYDELRRREEERARRRLARLAGAAVFLALTFLALALLAWYQWDRAESELRVARAQNLATQGQVAYDAAADAGALGTASPERGVLLALEALQTHPTVQGDFVLREGLWRLGRPRLRVPVEEGADLAAIGPGGRWIHLQTESGMRSFDVASASYRDTGTSATVLTQEEALGDTLAQSQDGRYVLVESEVERAGWMFAGVAVHRDGEQVAVLPHEWHLQLAAFSADSRWLLTVSGRASMDAEDPAATALVGSTVRVWEIPSGRKVSEVSLAHLGGILQTALSPDGEWLATLSEPPSGREVLLWPIWPDILRAEACRQLTRNLSPSEWQTFVPFRPYRATCERLPIVSE